MHCHVGGSGKSRFMILNSFYSTVTYAGRKLQVIVITLSSHILGEGWPVRIQGVCVCARVCASNLTARHLPISACARVSAKPLLLLSRRAEASPNFDALYRASPRRQNHLSYSITTGRIRYFLFLYFYFIIIYFTGCIR